MIMNAQDSPPSTQLGDETFMSVADLKAYVAEVESAKASQSYGAVERAEKAKKEMIDKLMRRVEITPERVQSFLSRVKAAAARGESEMMVMRFPSALCVDHGRALNNSEPGWPGTLVGQPRQFYEIWKERLEPAGYRLKAMIVDWPNGFPGDVGLFVAWK
jgi:hypothetical protein